MKKANNLLAVEDRQNMSMEHEYRLGVTLSESIIENYARRPLAGYHNDVISGFQENVISSEKVHERYEVTMER